MIAEWENQFVFCCARRNGSRGYRSHQYVLPVQIIRTTDVVSGVSYPRIGRGYYGVISRLMAKLQTRCTKISGSIKKSIVGCSTPMVLII